MEYIASFMLTTLFVLYKIYIQLLFQEVVLEVYRP